MMAGSRVPGGEHIETEMGAGGAGDRVTLGLRVWQDLIDQYKGINISAGGVVSPTTTFWKGTTSSKKVEQIQWLKTDLPAKDNPEEVATSLEIALQMLKVNKEIKPSDRFADTLFNIVNKLVDGRYGAMSIDIRLHPDLQKFCRDYVIYHEGLIPGPA